MIRNKIIKILDVPKLIIRIWIILWVTLFLFLLAKLCFNIWYPIVVNNKFILNICNYIDNNIFLQFSMGLFLYIFSVNIWILTTIKSFKYKNKIEFITFNIMIIIGFLLKFSNLNFGGIFELLYLVLIPIVINLKRNNFNLIKIKRKIRYKFGLTLNIIFPIIIYVIFNLFQLNILFIRGIKDILTNMPTLIQYALQIDYYIFLIITWIGVKYFMGWLTGGWFFGKSLTELQAIKQEELAKDKPDEKFIKELDEAIAKKENEVKD